MELYSKIQKWIDSIISDDLENVAKESKGLENRDVDPKLNKFIFKALLCLTHTADRSKPSQTQTGKQIFHIADNLLCSLTEIPDLTKYYSSLYHIAKKLIAMQLYPEAMQVTAWSFPSKLIRDLTTQHYDMYPKIANLWHEPALDLMESLPKHGIPKTGHKLLLEFLSNELRVLEVIAEERSAYVLCRVIRYLIKLYAVTRDVKHKGSQSHCDVAISFLKKMNVALIGEEKYEVYHDVLRFVNLATTAAIASGYADKALTVFTESCDIFETIFNGDTELCGCLLLYKSIGLMLLKPLDESQNIPDWELGAIKQETTNIMNNFKDGKGVSWSMRMVSYILQSLFDRWDNCISTGDKGFLNGPVLRNVFGLMRLMFVALNSIPANRCEVCRDNGCRMEKNTHSVTVVGTKSLAILFKISAGDLLKDIFTLVRELAEENVAAILEMKEAACGQWSALWTNCGINIYNLSVTCHKTLYEETASLFSLLCCCIVRFEGINAVNSKINIKHPLSYVLHRLSSVHFNHGNYREALTPCALNGLLSYQNPDSKAFRMWASIKHACAKSNTVLKMTMLSCLKEDMDVISEIGINVRLRDYDLNDLCLQELRGLHEARCNLSLAMQSVLDELQILNSSGLEYAQGVNLLGHHLLHYQYDENFPRYLKRAIRKLKEDKFAGNLHLLAAANLDFYTFVMNLHKIVDQTKAEMETAKFALKASKSVSHEGQPKNNDTVVPAYTKINVSEDSKLFSNLQQALNKWSTCIGNDIIGIIEEWHLVVTLRTLVIVGEYSRLHKFSTLESKAWELAYKVASQLRDSRTCVYIIGRSTSLGNLNSEWIKTGNELTNELTSSPAPEADNAVAFFWIGLSNLYFEIGKYEEATNILHRVLALPNIGPLKNVPEYLSSMDTVLKNYRFCSNDNRSTKYMAYIVKSLYSMVSLMEYLPQPRVGAKKKQLYSSEVLLTCTAHMSLRMNSLLSFKEISSHVINRLKLSQASGAALRVVECLKNLCFIDLSRMQLDDCVVKVQGMEYMLQTEYIEESRRTKNPVTSTNELDKPGARDTRVNDTSPVLRKTVFKLPDFFTHEKCSCYKCSSVDYQYLVLSGTHIRAQLYFLQGHLDEALEHFNGAFYLRRKMLHLESRREINRREITEEKIKGRQYPWKDYYDTVEYVLLLLDFSRFIRELAYDDAINVAVEAARVCERFRLQSHPIYIAAKELVLEYQFCEMFDDGDFSKFTVPDASRIDINKFTHVVSGINSSSISTPASKPLGKKPRTIRRVRTPPLLKLTKVSMILSEDEDDEGPQSPKSSRRRTKAGKSYGRPKSLTRKKLQEFLESSPDPCDAENKDDAGAGAAGMSRLKVPEEFIAVETAEAEKELRTISQKTNKAASIFPNLAKQLDEVLDEEGRSDAEPKIESKSKNSHRTRLSNKTEDEVVDKLVTSFKEILIGNKDVSKVCFNDANSSENCSFNTDNARESDTLGVDKQQKKRPELSEFSERISSGDSKGVTQPPKPECIRRKEKLRTSDRIKKSRSQSVEAELKKPDDPNIVYNLERCKSGEEKEKPKRSAGGRIKSLRDGLDGVLAPGDEGAGKKFQEVKKNPPNLRRIERSRTKISSTMSSSAEIIESSQLDDSNIVPTSDLEEKARENGVVHKYKTRTMSRIMRSRSQNNATSSRLKSFEKSDTVSTSDPEELPETTKCKRSGERRKPKALSGAEKSDKHLSFRPARASGSPDSKEGQKISELINLEEPEAAVKKQVGKRPTSGRSKLKR